ncbi:DMT family transporter [Consotaella salsifontis]|uniref:EamA domain-containing membrane protein RarD n=1 Tax=Consotaella salsifontis TaxID=1365950 RepID=A0A1T4Q5P7_9HYPH|nr:DMT family transporter [Consotaella salsifontis]SJZ99016.1 EamA domain-containing membrane protein RarD [Consotaella salsifontis]
MRAREWFGLLLLSVLWGSSYFFFQLLAKSLPPLTVVVGRVGIAAALLGAVTCAMGKWQPLGAKRWYSFLTVAALSNVLPFALTVWSEARITGGLASILNATTPSFTIVVAWAAGREVITWNKVLGLALGLIGVAVLIGISALRTGSGQEILGILAVLLAAFSYALAGVYGQRFHDLAPIQVATVQLAAATLISLPLALAVEHPWTIAMPSIDAIGALLGIALISTAPAYILYYRILFAAGPTNLFLVTLLMPVTALALGVLIFGERPSAAAIAGMVIIGVSLLVIDGRLLKSHRSPRDG